MTAADHTATDHYGTLQVEPDADAAAIRTAYLRLMRDTHPDLRPGDPGAAARAQQLNVAYTVLRSPVARAGYDRVRAARAGAGRTASPVPRPSGDAAYTRLIDSASSRAAYSQDQHDLREAFHTASLRLGVALFAVGAILLLALALGQP